jgi:NagD protein
LKYGYLIDMDGVLYRGHELISGAEYFIQQLRERRIPFRLLTNNSQRTRRDIVAKLARMGIEVEDEHVYTSAMATARYLAGQKPNGTAFVIGEGGLLNALHQNGYAVVDHDPDYVVIGEGRTFSLELVEAAVRMVARGAKLVATNLDPNCPTPDGPRPGCGAMVAMLEAATGIRAFSVGKPSPVMMRAARKEMDLATDRDDRRHDGDGHPRRRPARLPHHPGAERRHGSERLGPVRDSPTWIVWTGRWPLVRSALGSKATIRRAESNAAPDRWGMTALRDV